MDGLAGPGGGRMKDLISRFIGKTSSKSKEDAKNRLKFLLIHDQVDLTPAQLESMKKEILEVIGRYVKWRLMKRP